MSSCLLLSLLLFVVTATNQSAAVWLQDCGDQASTNFVPYVGPSPRSGWNYTRDVPCDGGCMQLFINSPAVSEEGVMFTPFVYQNIYPPLFQVRAILSNGKEKWIAHWRHMADGPSCSSLRMTNAVYSRLRNMVVVGWSCAYSFPYYAKRSRLLAHNATNGTIIWRSDVLLYNDATKIAINEQEDAVYIGGGFSCDMDGLRPAQGDLSQNVSNITAISMKDGSTMWVYTTKHAGCSMQIKLGPQQQLLVPVHMPDGTDPRGKLLSLTSNKQVNWVASVGITRECRIAFSSHGVLYGVYGLAGRGDLIFGLSAATGKKLFSNQGSCDPGAFPSGPAVDKEGNAYYRYSNDVTIKNGLALHHVACFCLQLW